MRRLTLLLLALFAMGGCAGVTYTPVPVTLAPLDPANAEQVKAVQDAHGANVKADAKAEGLRYYGSSLYLILNSDGKGNVQWRLMELPDQTKKKMAAQPSNFVAQIKTNFRFQHGMLTGSAEQVDETAVPRAALDALTKVLPSLAAAMASQNPPQVAQAPAPSIYKFLFDGQHIELRGGPGDVNISVSLSPQTK